MIDYHKKREQKLAARKIYRDANKDKINKTKQDYYLKNKDRIIKQLREKPKPSNIKERYKLDHKRRYGNLKGKMQTLCRSRVTYAVKQQGCGKFASTENLIGCSIKYLIKHLESQFQEGMTWDNHTKTVWHIDHIYPCSAFDLSLKEEQLKCFHYSNMRPMWAEENMSKGCKILTPKPVFG